MPKLWPLARLAVLILAVTLWAHYALNWSPPAPAAIAAASLGLLKLYLLCLMLSAGLAHLLAVVLAFPAYAILMLNCLLYGLSLWLAHRLSNPARPRLTAALALMFELILVLALASLLEYYWS